MIWHNIQQLAKSGNFTWDVETGKELKVFNTGDHDYNIKSVAYIPELKAIVSVSGNGIVRLWDIETGKVLKVFKGEKIKHKISMGGVTKDSEYTICIDDMVYIPELKAIVGAAGAVPLQLLDIETEAVRELFQTEIGVLNQGH